MFHNTKLFSGRNLILYVVHFGLRYFHAKKKKKKKKSALDPALEVYLLLLHVTTLYCYKICLVVLDVPITSSVHSSDTLCSMFWYSTSAVYSLYVIYGMFLWWYVSLVLLRCISPVLLLTIPIRSALWCFSESVGDLFLRMFVVCSSDAVYSIFLLLAVCFPDTAVFILLGICCSVTVYYIPRISLKVSFYTLFYHFIAYFIRFWYCFLMWQADITL